MAIIRGALPADGFTLLENTGLRDPALGLRAKGLLAYLTSHHPGYVLTIEQIVRESRDGRRAVDTAIAELLASGYLERERRRMPDGTYGPYDYTLISPGQSHRAKRAVDPARETHTGDDQPEQDVSPGGDQCALPTVDSAQSKKTTGRRSPEDSEKAPPSRGTRLPENFSPDESMRQWYAEQRFERYISGRLEHQRFTDYWRGRAGSAGRKVDWTATWRNWMRRAAQEQGWTLPGEPTPQPARPRYPSATEREQQRRAGRDRVADLAQQIMDERGWDGADAAAVTLAWELATRELGDMGVESGPLAPYGETRTAREVTA